MLGNSNVLVIYSYFVGLKIYAFSSHKAQNIFTLLLVVFKVVYIIYRYIIYIIYHILLLLHFTFRAIPISYLVNSLRTFIFI